MCILSCYHHQIGSMTHCYRLELGHGTMVCAVCLSIFVWALWERALLFLPQLSHGRLSDMGPRHSPSVHPVMKYGHSWTSYQIRKIAGCACARNAGNVFPRRRFQSKPLVSDPGMHHGTCVTHVPWCMSGSLTCGDGENVPGIPGACAPAILRIWQEAHSVGV